MKRITTQAGIEVKDIVESLSQEDLYRRKMIEKQPPPPPSVKVSPSSFKGSLHVTITPPYEYQWTWSATWNDPRVFTLSAERDFSPRAKC